MDGGTRGAPQQATGHDFAPAHPASYRSHSACNCRGATRQGGQGAGRTSRGGRPTGGGGGGGSATPVDNSDLGHANARKQRSREHYTSPMCRPRYHRCLAKAIERQFGELTLRKRGISAAKNLVAGVRILERLELIPATITNLHRLQLQAIGKMAKAEDRPRVLATMADSQTLAEHGVQWAWARVFFAVGMAFPLCLRVSDVVVLRWGWLGHKNWMVFLCAQPIPPFWERWRAWLYEHRRPHHHDNAPKSGCE